MGYWVCRVLCYGISVQARAWGSYSVLGFSQRARGLTCSSKPSCQCTGLALQFVLCLMHLFRRRIAHAACDDIRAGYAMTYLALSSFYIFIRVWSSQVGFVGVRACFWACALVGVLFCMLTCLQPVCVPLLKCFSSPRRTISLRRTLRCTLRRTLTTHPLLADPEKHRRPSSQYF